MRPPRHPGRAATPTRSGGRRRAPPPTASIGATRGRPPGQRGRAAPRRRRSAAVQCAAPCIRVTVVARAVLPILYPFFHGTAPPGAIRRPNLRCTSATPAVISSAAGGGAFTSKEATLVWLARAGHGVVLGGALADAIFFFFFRSSPLVLDYCVPRAQHHRICPPHHHPLH
ncbi:hypothetical protein BU14_0091s0017 [Porphyra umbilicalis]|uniref:Uncharacterized protein n=1 Tax=Porphyra umbilicalis TaxID=2786 RepID=A0A1X6PDT5_PORUM|nr:hypothetical protein BU14_0091s0017 [Porphyra umbilicalis]|eukprot:OSX79037.1 hypothetical protein BU14_0091s0017 [Porphyra umbilicalis]